jgi:hypothetical protein
MKNLRVARSRLRSDGMINLKDAADKLIDYTPISSFCLKTCQKCNFRFIGCPVFREYMHPRISPSYTIRSSNLNKPFCVYPGHGEVVMSEIREFCFQMYQNIKREHAKREII